MKGAFFFWAGSIYRNSIWMKRRNPSNFEVCTQGEATFWGIYWFTTTHEQSTIPSRYPYWPGHVDGWSMLIDHSEVEGNSCIIGSLEQSVIIVGISSIAKLIFQCEVFIRCLRSKVICKQKPHLPYNHGWYHHHKQSLNFFQVEVQDRGCEMVSVMEIGGDLEQDMVTW